jgi:dual specificity tyrosine-phosphorylation-regulated kinase 2/3/4
LYKDALSDYEKEEILEYEQVYYVGVNCAKKPAARDKQTNNHGYDDERGDYYYVEHDHIMYRYEITGKLGGGSFGQVFQCRDHATGEMVAIKIIRNKKRFHHQALVEIKVLENLRKWVSPNRHIFLICEFVEAYLYLSGPRGEAQRDQND